MAEKPKREAKQVTQEPIISDIPVEDQGGESVVSDLPEEVTESYGTGIHPKPGLNVGGRTMNEQMSQYKAVSPELSAGDVDAAWSQAEGTAEETVGGTAATPDQDIVDNVGSAVGLEMDDKSFLRTNKILEDRDSRRWELDPQSSEDYQKRRD